MISFASAKETDLRDVVLELKNVNKHDGDAVSLNDISFTVRRGEIVTLLGRANSGKSAVLKLAAGLDRIGSGELYLSDRMVDSSSLTGFAPPLSRNVGLVLRSYAVWPHMTVAQNVSYPLAARHKKGPDVRQTVSTILEQVGLGGMEQRPASQLDQREQLLLAVARSLATSPDLVLLDEPFSVLSPADRYQMRGDLRILQRKIGVAMLIATSDEVEALSLSDRVVIMENGSIKQIGSPIELYRHPSTEDILDRMGRTITLSGRVDGPPGIMANVTLFSEDGPTLKVGHVHGDGLDDGGDCRVTFRPESADVVPMTEAPSSDERNVITGIIAALLFVGDCYEATIELPRGESIRLDLPLSTDWREGQPIAVIVRSEDMHLWPNVAQQQDQIEELPDVPRESDDSDAASEVASGKPGFLKSFNMELSLPKISKIFKRG